MTGFFSEFGEDEWIAKNLRLPRWGVYVDLGSGHPERCSNTAFLRARGWCGLAVDGNRNNFGDWPEDPRTVLVDAIISPLDSVGFLIHENGPWSRIDPAAPPVPARTLESVLDEYDIGRIDFLSIDLEGAEFDAFQTFNLQRHCPSIIVAEYDTAGIGKDFRLRDQLACSVRKGGRGALRYRLVHETANNFIFALNP